MLGVLVLKGMGWAYYVTPRWVQRGLEASLALLLRSYRADIVRSNLERAFPDAPISEIALKQKQFTREFAHTLWGMLMLLGPHRRWLTKRMGVQGLDHYQQALSDARAQGTGVILLCGHLGHWEQALARAALAGVDVLMVTKQLKWDALHRQFEASRRSCGLKSTYEPKTLKDVLNHLKSGGAVAFALDQYTGPPVNVRVPFFGTYVGTQRAVAALVRRTGAPVVPIYAMRDRLGNSFAVFEPKVEPMVGDSEAAVLDHTAIMVARWEAAIRKNPAQWLWSHRRFKGDLSNPSQTSMVSCEQNESPDCGLDHRADGMRDQQTTRTL